MTRLSPAFDQRIADWLEDDPDQAPSQVTATVLAALPSIRQRRRGWFPTGGRTFSMSTTMRLAAGVAIAAIVGVGALAYLNRVPDTGGPPSPSPSTPATPSPAPAAFSYVGAGATVSVTMPEGWERGAFNLSKSPARELPDGANLLFREPTITFGDPCDEASGETVATVNDLVAALSDLPYVTNAAATGVTLSGFSGQHVEFVVDTEGIDCLMALYAEDQFIRAAENGQREDVWILDVNGAPFVVDAATYPETSATDRAELLAIVDAVVIEPSE